MTTMTQQQTTTSPGAAFTHVMTSAVEFAAAKFSQKADGWTGKLNDVAAGGGKQAADAGGELAADGFDAAAESGDARQQAGARGVRAGLQGKNPVWAAIKGAWSGGGLAGPGGHRRGRGRPCASAGGLTRAPAGVPVGTPHHRGGVEGAFGKQSRALWADL